jgi:hypothetical protein
MISSRRRKCRLLGLKPQCLCIFLGTTEVVPLRETIDAVSSDEFYAPQIMQMHDAFDSFFGINDDK